MAEIRLNDLTKHYRQGKETVRALDGVDLDIGAGEFVSVVGRSGSGKTTLLDLVGLLLRPTRGSVVLDGVDTSTLRGRQPDRGRAHRAHATAHPRGERDVHDRDTRPRAGRPHRPGDPAAGRSRRR